MRHLDTLIGVFSSALHGSGIISHSGVGWSMSWGSTGSFASFTIADIVSSETSFSRSLHAPRLFAPSFVEVLPALAFASSLWLTLSLCLFGQLLTHNKQNKKLKKKDFMTERQRQRQRQRQRAEAKGRGKGKGKGKGRGRGRGRGRGSRDFPNTF